MMYATMYQLYTSPLKRLHSRFSRKCNIELESGRHIIIEKHGPMYSCELPFPNPSLSKEEEMDMLHAQMLMGL